MDVDIKHLFNFLKVHGSFLLEGSLYLRVMNPQLCMKVDIVWLSKFDSLNFFFNLIDSPQKISLVIVLSVLYNTPSEINSIYQSFLTLKCLKLKWIDLLHYLQPEIYQLLESVCLLIVEQTVSHSLNWFHVLLLFGSEGSWFDDDGFPDELIVVGADCVDDDLLKAGVHSMNCSLLMASIWCSLKYFFIFSLPKVMNLAKLK